VPRKRAELALLIIIVVVVVFRFLVTRRIIQLCPF
jgi:hypothetical protein